MRRLRLFVPAFARIAIPLFLRVFLCMLSNSLKIVIAFLLVLSACGTRGASIESLVAEALARNPELNFFAAEIAATRGELRTAVQRPYPDLSTNLGGKHV